MGKSLGKVGTICRLHSELVVDLKRGDIMRTLLARDSLSVSPRPYCVHCGYNT
jgi:hypothetical protein